MTINKVQFNYNKFYKSIGFERKELFDLLKDEINPQTILYPGCSIHVTPSFVFQHVVYIDKSDFSADFFKEIEQVIELISQNKEYQQKPFIRYYNNDFADKINLLEGSFDLLISIYSGTQIQYFEKFVKPKGCILSANLFSDNEYMNSINKYDLIGTITSKSGKYQIDSNMNIPIKDSKLRRSNTGFKYIDNEVYYLYKNIIK